jgi:hypothetical protein
MIRPSSIDLSRLRADLVDIARSLAQVKRVLRRTWTEPMAEHQARYVKLRRRATDLCILRARLRGKYHLGRPLREGAYPGMQWDREAFHARVAERTAGEYLRESVPVPKEAAPCSSSTSE